MNSITRTELKNIYGGLNLTQDECFFVGGVVLMSALVTQIICTIRHHSYATPYCPDEWIYDQSYNDGYQQGLAQRTTIMETKERTFEDGVAAGRADYRFHFN